MWIRKSVGCLLKSWTRDGGIPVDVFTLKCVTGKVKGIWLCSGLGSELADKLVCLLGV